MSIEQFASQKPTLSLSLKGVTRPLNRPAFSEMSYGDLAGQLGYYYKELAAFMTTPAIVRYSDLAGLRQRAISPDLTNPSFNRYQAQLQLAAELLRLGRRREGFLLLQTAADRLLQWEDQASSLCFLVWIALLRATANDPQGAFLLACQVSAQLTQPTFDNVVAQFFRVIYTPPAFMVQN